MWICSLLAAAQLSNSQAANTFNCGLLSLLELQCCSVPDLIGKLIVVATYVAQLPVQKPSEDQQDKDQEQRPHNGPDNHRCSVWSCRKKV